ncbi:sensor histidine kinase [Corynebacterium halotolerans]|uniref:sensor histidine kinase n=1 Tax=Corynebacterium halotolerans TaxID=225326 RepID=UPI003CFBA597
MSPTAPVSGPALPEGTARPLLRLLLLLRVALHVIFAFLLGFGLLRFLLQDPERAHRTPVLPLVCALALVYLAGTVWEDRYARGRTRADPARGAWWWLGAVTLLWIGLVAHTQDFVWLLFPLIFLFLHLLPRVVGPVAVLALWAVAAFVPAWLHPESWGVAAAVGPAIGAVFAVATYYTYRALHAEVQHHRRIAAQLRATRQELAVSEHQAGRLEERERLSREIHDTVAQGLSSIVLVSRAADQSLRRGDTAGAARQLATIREAAVDNLAEARRFVRDLAAPALETDLPAALREVIRRVDTRQDSLGQPLAISLQLAGDVHRDLPEPISTAVVRVCQEALANVVKHAAADAAVVTLAVWDLELTLDVFDDGRGFDPDHTPPDSYGLRGLSRRLDSLGGTLTVESEPGEGTVLAVQIPLTSARPTPKEA